MKQAKKSRLFLAASAVLMTLAVACGGDDTPTEDEPLQLAETAPVEEEVSRECSGDMAWYCEDMELEVCEAVGCAIRVYEEQDYRMCYSASPRRCGELESRDLCEQVRGCEWLDG